MSGRRQADADEPRRNTEISARSYWKVISVQSLRTARRVIKELNLKQTYTSPRGQGRGAAHTKQALNPADTHTPTVQFAESS